MEQRNFRVMLTHRRTGFITYTVISVQSPSGHSAALQMAEAMYGRDYFVSMLA